MKKLFLLFMILGLTSISFIDTKAFTFNGSYDFNDIGLDTSLNELNGASLNDIFNYDYLETLPLVNYQGYRNGYELDNQNNVTFYEYVYIDKGYKNLFNTAQVESSFQTVTLIGNGINLKGTFYAEYPVSNLIVGKPYIMSWSTTVNSGNPTNSWRFLYKDNSLSNIVGKNNAITASKEVDKILLYGSGSSYVDVDYTFIQLEEGNSVTSYVNYGQISDIYKLNTTPIENTDLVQSLYLYNLENLPINTIKYYFAVFLLHKYNLPVDDLWNNAFNAGEASGYDTGYDFGLIDGFQQGEDYGYNIGYNDGLVSEVDTQYLLGFVTGTIDLLGVSIIPGITLGVFVFIPLFLGFIGFIFRLGGRRG